MNASPQQKPAARALLCSGLESLGLQVDVELPARLLAFVDLLQRWNRTQNLTAISDPADMVSRHLLDSLAVQPWIRGARLIDVGSGAGLPGIPLALCNPDRQFVLLDSQARRCRFLFQARTELGLDNVDVIRCRVEEHRPARAYDVVLSRAFSSLPEFLRMAGHLCAGNGVILAMKGRYPEREIRALQMPYNVRACHRLDVPGLAAERHLVEINRSGISGDRDDP